MKLARLAPLVVLATSLSIACGEDPKDDPAPPEGDTDTDTATDGATDADADGDTDADADADADSDADTDIQDDDFFDFRDDHYPLVEGSVFCSAMQGMYVVRGGALAESDGVQANIYAYFAGELPPDGGSFPVMPYDGTELTPGSAFVMAMDTEDSTFWWGSAGSVEVIWMEDVLYALWQDVPVFDQISPATTDITTAQLHCTPG